MSSSIGKFSRVAAAPPAALLPVVGLPSVAPPWELQATPLGQLARVTAQQSRDFCHGRVNLWSCRAVQAAQVAILALNDAWHDVDLSRLLFLDTETTGLAGGAGTLAFVVGLGHFTAEGWRTEQLILPQPGQEGPLLRRLAEHLDQASAVVTYNGKSFDWPLLKMRFIINRLAMPPLHHHLDLLHCSRRIYKRQNLSLRLVALEERLLDFRRHGDVDGAAIPQLYFDFLRGAPAATLRPVVHHNALDLHAMAALLSVLGQALEQPVTHGSPGDCLSIAELYLRAGQLPTARALAAAVPTPFPSIHDVQAHLMVARLCQRAGDWAGCEAALQAALRCAPATLPQQRASVHLRLAKFYEHRRRHMELALHHAKQAQGSESGEAQLHRLARLRRKTAAHRPS